MRHYGKLDSGYRAARLRSAASKAFLSDKSVMYLYCLGSFIRSSPFRDIDLVLVVDRRNVREIDICARFRQKCQIIEECFRVPVHLCVLGTHEIDTVWNFRFPERVLLFQRRRGCRGLRVLR